MLKKIMILILTVTILAACNTPSKLSHVIRRAWSVHFDDCLCQWYDPNKINGTSKMILCEDFHAEFFPELELKENKLYCDDLVGFSAKTWTSTLTPELKELKDWIIDQGE